MFDYPQRRRTSRRPTNRSPKKLPECWTRTSDHAVVTIVDPSLRKVLDRCTDADFPKVHASSITEALTAVRANGAATLLLSPCIVRRQSRPEISRLVRKCPGVTVVAVLGEDWVSAQEPLLALGACGVRQVINLAQREGWVQLRRIVAQESGKCGQQILRGLLSALDGATDESRHFFGTLVRAAPDVVNVRAFGRMLGVQPSTLMSRFFRASLPAPKTYLAMTRLLYAAAYFENARVSIADVANRLNYSSPQSFGRHIRTLLGISAGEYRKELSLPKALEHYVNRLIVPHRETFQTFDPLGPGPIHVPLDQEEMGRPVALVAEA